MPSLIGRSTPEDRIPLLTENSSDGRRIPNYVEGGEGSFNTVYRSNSAINILRSSSSFANMPSNSPRAIVIIEGDSSWSRRREIQDRIKRRAEQSGCQIDEVIVTSADSFSNLPRNLSSAMLRSVESTDEENDPLAGIRVQAPYINLISEMRGREGAEIVRICQRPFQDRRVRPTAIEEGNRHRYNLISRLSGPPLPLPMPGDSDANHYDRDTLNYGERFLTYPDHLIPAEHFLLHLPIVKETGTDGKQSSIVTILAIWNTMMGTSLLATPWAISQSGVIMGPSVAIVTAFIASYTAVSIVNNRKEVEKYQPIHEFAPLAGCVLGRKAEIAATIFSLLAVGGAAVVYWVLMSNFAYNGIAYIYDSLTNSTMHELPSSNESFPGVICPSSANYSGRSQITFYEPYEDSPPLFDRIWNQSTTPIFLVLLLFPLISIKSVGFFTKLNSLGTMTVFFIIGLVAYYGFSWGINAEFNDQTVDLFVPLFKWTFPCLTGLLSLGFFIHNCVITITSNNRNQENNARDVTTAFVLVTITYLIIGTTFYLAFPLKKSCLEDNFLNNFHSNDVLAVFTRWILLFQLTTVFPLVVYILRSQVYLMIFDIHNPSYFQNFLCNLGIVIVAVLIAIFYPKIGTIIRFSGSLCGFFLIFFLPSLVNMAVTKGKIDSNERLGKLFIFLHIIIIILGLLNLIAQFFM